MTGEIRCELAVAEDGATVSVTRAVGCAPADVGEMCWLVATGDSVVRDADVSVSAASFGRLLWLGDRVPLPADYAGLVSAAEAGASVGGRVRCEIELLPGGTVTLFRSPACTEGLAADLAGQVAGRSARVRDVTPGASGALWPRR